MLTTNRTDFISNTLKAIKDEIEKCGYTIDKGEIVKMQSFTGYDKKYATALLEVYKAMVNVIIKG